MKARVRRILRSAGSTLPRMPRPSDLQPLWLPVTVIIGLVGLAGIPDDTTTWGRIVRDHAPWVQNTWVITALLGVGLVLLSLYWGNVIANFKNRRLLTGEPYSAPRSDWQQDWHELKFRRSDFWSSAISSYDYWNESHGHPPLHTLIGMAPFPADLPLDPGVQFPDWVWNFGNPQLTGAAAALNSFATAVYPAVKPAKAATSMIFLGGYVEFCKFDDFRAELSKFWDHWGRQEPMEQIIREQRANDLVKNHANEIKLLTYLEIARERWAQQGAPGKSGLFKLGKRNAETSD